MTIREVIGILRNEPCVGYELRKEAWLMAADIIEQYLKEKEFWRIRQHKRVY